MTKLTTERLEKFVNDIKTDGMCEITDSQVESALIRLLAYEQAAKNSADLKTLVISEIVDFYAGFESPGEPETVDEAQSQLIGRIEKVFGLAARVLPKQPELVDLSQQVEILNRILNWILKELPVPTQKASAMAIRLSSVIDIISDLEVSAPAQPKQPKPTISFYRDGIIAAAKWVENQRDAYDNEHGQSDPDTGAFEFGNDAQLEYSTTLSEIAEGIRSLHPASAQPVSEPYKLPQGYALVPCKLTAENGAKSCMIGEFTEQTEISCPECFGDDECETCDGSGMIEVTVPVSWTTIKDIWAKGIEHFAAAPAQESE